MTNVGTISLDLVIKENLQKQLNKIQSMYSKPIEQMNNATKQMFEKTFDDVADTAQKATDKTQRAIDRIIKKAKKRQKWSPPKDYDPKYDTGDVEADVNRIMQEITGEVDKTASKVVDKVHETVQKGKKIFEEFEFPADPIERLEKELSITQELIGLAQKKWQELKSQLSELSDEDISLGLGDKLQAERIKAEKQLMVLQASAEKTEQAIAEGLSQKKPEFENFFEQIKYGLSEALEGGKIALRKAMSAVKTIISTPFRGVANTIIAPFRTAKNGIIKLFLGLKYYLENPLEVVKKVAVRTFSAIKSAGTKAFNSIKSVAGKAIDGIKGKFSSMHSSMGTLEKPVSRLGRSIKNAFRRVFVMAGILAMLKALRSAITDTANKNDEFAKSLNQIKGNLQVAFLPIINTVMPALNALMSGLAAATKTMAAFINTLFGTTYKKSLDTLKKAQSASKTAQKEAAKAATYLNSYDEMNTAQDTSSDSSSESSEQSGIDYSALNGDSVQLPDWAQRMKDAIKSGDWKGVGALLAEKLNSAFDNINWNKIQQKVNGFMRGIAEGLNGFVEKLNWGKLGETVGNGINTIFGGIYTFMKRFNWSKLGKSIAQFLNSAIKKTDWALIGRTLASKWVALVDTLYAFVANFDWSGFGQSIGTSVNAWFDEIDWAKTAATLSEGIKGLLDSIMGFIETVDWEQMGEDLWTFVKNIDWAGIIEKLFKTIGELLAAGVKLLWGFIKEAVYKIRDYFKEKIQECGGSIVKGLFKGILDALIGLGKWINEHIFKPFIDGFKKVFGIHSPSKVMAEMGSYIIEGLKNAIINGIKTVRDAFEKILEAIHKVFEKIGEWFKDKFGGAWTGIKTAFSRVGEFFGDVWKAIKKPFLSIGTWFKGKFKAAWEGVKSVTKTVWDKIVDVIKAPINLIIGAVNGMLNAVENAINWIIGGINDLSFDVPDWVPVIGGETFGFDIPEIDIPEIPKLATGGLATAPTLAMVGDNRNAQADPEVIAPLSKLQGMLDDGKLDEVSQLLRDILAYLKSIEFTFYGTVDGRPVFEFVREMNEQYKRRTGVSAF